MSLSTETIKALKAAERFNPQTFTFNGTSYACTLSTLDRGHDLEIGGEVYGLSMSIFVRVDTLGAVRIANGDRVTVSSREYRVISVNEIGGQYELVLSDVSV